MNYALCAIELRGSLTAIIRRTVGRVRGYFGKGMEAKNCGASQEDLVKYGQK
jgi:hypothetical protein